MRDSFGIMQLSGKPGEKPGEKWKYGKASVKELKARRWEKCLFSFWLVWSAHGGRSDSHGVVWHLIAGYDVFRVCPREGNDWVSLLYSVRYEAAGARGGVFLPAFPTLSPG